MFMLYVGGVIAAVCYGTFFSFGTTEEHSMETLPNLGIALLWPLLLVAMTAVVVFKAINAFKLRRGSSVPTH